MPTIWQMLMNFRKKPEEMSVHNPLKLLIGSRILIDTVDLANDICKIVSIREINTKINNKNNKFTDYELKLSNNENSLLRVSENENGNHFILLKKLDSFPYNKEYHEGLKFENNNGEAMEGDATYWRIDDCQSEWIASVAYLKDINKDGKIQSEEIDKSNLTYWDFYRQTENEVGTEYIEYYFVEMDEYGVFTIWIGSEIDQTRITTLNEGQR